MTTVAEPTKKAAKKKVAVSDSTIAAVERLHNDEALNLTDQEVVAMVEERNGIKDTAPPKPGEPGFDWQACYPGEKVFTYTHDDVTVGLAAISQKRQPTIGFLRQARKQPEFEQVLDMVEFIACDAALELVDGWVPTDLIGMFEQWSEWNRTGAGE